MSEPEIDIPTKALFKASEVCEIAGVASYVLRSWEHEFAGLGIARAPGGPRIYRRSDVEKVLRIKHLVFGEGLTLAGARRTIEGEPAEGSADDEIVVPLDDEARRRLTDVKRGLKSLLEMLSGGAAGAETVVGNEGGAGDATPAAAAGGEFELAREADAPEDVPPKTGRKRAWSKAASGAVKRAKRSPGVGA